MSEQSPLSEQQRQLLADKLFQAAVEHAERARVDETPDAASYAYAAYYLTDAFVRVTHA